MLRIQIAQTLEKTGARNVRHDDNQIRFSGKLLSWSLSKWNLYFNMISKGSIAVDCRDSHLHVAYQISFTDLFAWLVAIVSFWMLVLFVFAEIQFSQALPFLGFFFLLFVWLGGNVVLTYYFFNRFIKKCVRNFFNSASNAGVQGRLIASR
ncbi:hypothetical protein ANRL3_02752 [Anaerolineae bacterium]|nr:hypothetical protein ANRL3_02752 [Anaerolineae bacterium]